MPVGNILILFANKYLDKKIAIWKIDILTKRPLINGLFYMELTGSQIHVGDVTGGGSPPPIM